MLTFFKGTPKCSRTIWSFSSLTIAEKIYQYIWKNWQALVGPSAVGGPNGNYARTKLARISSSHLTKQRECSPSALQLRFGFLISPFTNTHPLQFQLHIYVFDEGFSLLQGWGNAVSLAPWYNTEIQICQSCFVTGSEEVLLIDTSGQARIFSLVAQQFRQVFFNAKLDQHVWYASSHQSRISFPSTASYINFLFSRWRLLDFIVSGWA